MSFAVSSAPAGGSLTVQLCISIFNEPQQSRGFRRAGVARQCEFCVPYSTSSVPAVACCRHLMPNTPGKAPAQAAANASGTSWVVSAMTMPRARTVIGKPALARPYGSAALPHTPSTRNILPYGAAAASVAARPTLAACSSCDGGAGPCIRESARLRAAG